MPLNFLIPLIIFVVSGAGIISVVGIKMYQQVSGATLPLTIRRNTVEEKVKQAKRGIRRQVSQLAGSVRATTLSSVSNRVATDISKFFGSIKAAMTAPEHWLDRRTRNLVSLIRGRQESQLKQRGKPSDFMRNIGHNPVTPANTSKKDKTSV